MLTELERSIDFMGRPFRLESQPMRPCLEESNRLAAAIVTTLHASADVLTGGEAPRLDELEHARLAHRQALDAWAGRVVREGMSPGRVLAGLDADHSLRVLSYLALAIGTNAAISVGATVDDSLQLPPGTPLPGKTRSLRRIARTLRTHLTPSSGVLQQSFRVGIGLALAVFIAGLLSLDHAFWVVLGTLSVLKSNALSTGRTTVQALVGTLIGFAIGTAFTVVSGTDSPILWAAFPLAVFLATYVAGAIGFVVGQAAFTVLLIILFNLIMPIGWRVGLARVEDIAVGVGISVIVSVLLWPRGARAELAGTVARLYRAVAGYLGVAFADIIINVSQGEATFRYEAVQSRDLAGEAFDRFVSERVKKVIEPEGAASLVAAGSHAILVGDLLTGVARTYVIASDAETASASGDGVVTALDEQTRVMLEGFESLAAELEGVRSSRHFVGVSEQSLRSTALECLEYWRKRPEAGPSVIAAIIACEWLQQLGELTDDLAVPVGTLAAAASEPWWR